ncbi:PEGA domain-containing protein [Candidatus Poribacteria bacterium]|nr:PEGA domain-containing protein [Candidatus Poribacteria bacterium]
MRIGLLVSIHPHAVLLSPSRKTRGRIPFLGCVLVLCGVAIFAQNHEAPMKPDNPLPQTKIGEDGAEMVLIPAGEFLMGTPESAIEQLVAEFAQYNTRPKIQRDWFVDEAPQHRVYLDAYYIDKYEVTNTQYKKFIAATGHREPSEWNNAQFNQPNQPVVGVSWDDALEYAKWAGKTLPTEAQWEKAARGQLVGKLYPWGDTWPPPVDGGEQRGVGNFFDAHIEGYSDGYAYTASVGSFSPNGYGLYDMAGNVLEWCLDAYETDYYRKSPNRNPVKNIDMEVRVFRVVRGGGWSSLSAELRCAYRGRDIPSAKYNLLGFRCAQWVMPPPPAPETIQETKNLGALQLSTTPPGAIVYIDGLPYGKTEQKPIQIVFDTGERGERSVEIKLELDGYATKTTRVPIRRQKLVRWENVALTLLSNPSPSPPLTGGSEWGGGKKPLTTHHSPDTRTMALIPAGEFLMGSGEGFDREKPPHTVYLHVYYIDKYEVTNAQYQQFMQATGYPAPAYWTQAPAGMKDFPIGAENPDHPVVGVSFDDALKYATWAGKTLPTEAQYEKAARGSLFGKKYPLGDTLTHNDANFLSTGGPDKWIYSAPVASFPPNNFGLYDMVGNIWEWCLDAYEPDYYSKSPEQNPVNQNFTATKKHAIRGGAWHMNVLYLSCSFRDGASGKSPYIGFRCVTLPEH